MKQLKRRWLVYAISGLILIGAGLSLSIEAALYRFQNIGGFSWIGYGTVALIIFNSGICLFGQGVIYKVRLDDKRQQELNN
ncbi:hypothetical protein GCM10011506_43600 [Marivirga lumbricoides]|uniref:Uncharacterized protein n=1 Tax=Marivirga lumbricoides TaxID=1046115 RepID=A0ABQ1N7E6_9BACT|nr:hypothetical protein GCM10011506_43600 [Marivirga lumbricoides]